MKTKLLFTPIQITIALAMILIVVVMAILFPENLIK